MSKYSDLIQETYKDDIAETTTSKYSDIIQEEYGDNQTSAMRASVFSSAPVNPDVAAQQYQISKQVNLPVNIVRAKENEIKQMTELNSIDYDAIAKNFPAVATQLSDPNKVGAIRDDVDKLSYFERISKSYKTSQENTELAPLYIKQMLSDIGNEKFKLTPAEENQLAFIEQEQQGNQPLEYKNKGGLLQGITTFAKNIPIYTAQAIPTILANVPTTLGGVATGAGIGAAATRTPAGALAGAGIGARAGTFLGAAQLETGLAYKELKDLVDESGKPIEKTAAAGGAIATGVVNGLLELVPFEAATAPIKKAFSREGIKQIAKTSAGREYLKNIGTLALTEGATEGVQEFFNIAFGEVAKAASKGDFALVGMKDANDTEGLLKFLSDSSQRVLQSAEAGVGAGLGLGAVTSGVTYAKQAYDQKKQGQAQQEQIKETTQNVKESKTFNRSQELFKDVTEETLGQQNVYIPAEKVQTYFQDKTPQEVEEFYKQVPEAREQLQDALESGGNLILKGNNAYAAFAQDAYAPLQDFASLSPENITDEAYQDAFLQDVVSNVNYDEKVKKVRTEQDIVNKNIETQIQNLGIPYRDAKDLITLTKAFYETNLKKYGNEQATKLLNNYFKNLQIKKEVYVDDVAEMLKKARAPQKALPKAGKPLQKFLKEKGGVKLGSNLAGELNALGITPKTAPALFKKTGGIGDVDNFPASEFAERFPNINAKVEGDYVDRQALLDLIAEEARGADISRQISEEQRLVEDFIRQLDELGLDLNAPDEEIKKAIDEYRKGGYNQDQTKTAAFKKWFGDSKVVDENGEPLVVYHGTPIGKFTEFSNFPAYFSPIKDIADIYQNPSASSIWYGSEISFPETKAVYLSLQNPFDTRIEEHRKVFEEKFFGKYGNLTPLSDRNLPDWTEGENLAEFIEENNLPYDGIILDEGGLSDTRDRGISYVAFSSTQIKSATGNKGTFDVNNPNILYQNQAPTFYSALEKQITDLPQGKGSPEQWAGIIKNLTQKGVKQEELDWTGIENWIKEQKGSVSKEQILDYLKANKIEVKEVVKGQGLSEKAIEEWLDGSEAAVRYDKKGDYWRASYGGVDIKENFDSEEEAQRALREEAINQIEQYQEDEDKTEFSKYTLAGGKNYRELLMTLPEKPEKTVSIIDNDGNVIKKFDTYEEGYKYINTKEFNEFAKSSGKQFSLKEKKDATYKSPHYEEPNILAHIRFNERKDQDGKKVMFVEELQSDWMQSMKKQKDTARDNLEKRWGGLLDRMKKDGILEVVCP